MDAACEVVVVVKTQAQGFWWALQCTPINQVQGFDGSYSGDSAGVCSRKCAVSTLASEAKWVLPARWWGKANHPGSGLLMGGLCSGDMCQWCFVAGLYLQARHLQGYHEAITQAVLLLCEEMCWADVPPGREAPMMSRYQAHMSLAAR